MPISRFEKIFSVYLSAMDAVGDQLLRRVLELLKARPDLEQAQFFRLIKRPTPSWQSEFLNGKRTTNNLRLVMRIAKVFGVTVSYMLGEGDRRMDAGASALMATWDVLGEQDRGLLLKIVAGFRERAETTAPSVGTADDDQDDSAGRRGVPRGGPPKRKR